MYGMCSSTAVGLGRADKITIKILTAAMTLGRDFLHFGKGRTFQGPSHQRPRPVGRTGCHLCLALGYKNACDSDSATTAL